MGFWYFEQDRYSAILGATLLFVFSYFMQGASVSNRVKTPAHFNHQPINYKQLIKTRATLNLFISICLLCLYYWWEPHPALLLTGLLTNFLLFLLPSEKFFNYIADRRSS
jgi:hypothetical protein